MITRRLPPKQNYRGNAQPISIIGFFWQKKVHHKIAAIHFSHCLLRKIAEYLAIPRKLQSFNNDMSKRNYNTVFG